MHLWTVWNPFCHQSAKATAFATDVLTGSNPMHRAQTKTVPLRGPFPIQWWAMRDVRVRLAPPAPRFVASLLACCAGKRFAFPQLRTLAGSNPMRWAQKRKASITGGLTIQWWAMRDVRVRLCRPPPLRAYGPRVLRWKTLRVSSAPHPCGFESLCDGPKNERPP